MRIHQGEGWKTTRKCRNTVHGEGECEVVWYEIQRYRTEQKMCIFDDKKSDEECRVRISRERYANAN